MKPQPQMGTNSEGALGQRMAITNPTASQTLFFFDGAFRTWVEVEQRGQLNSPITATTGYLTDSGSH